MTVQVDWMMPLRLIRQARARKRPRPELEDRRGVLVPSSGIDCRLPSRHAAHHSHAASCRPSFRRRTPSAVALGASDIGLGRGLLPVLAGASQLPVPAAAAWRRPSRAAGKRARIEVVDDGIRAARLPLASSSTSGASPAEHDCVPVSPVWLHRMAVERDHHTAHDRGTPERRCARSPRSRGAGRIRSPARSLERLGNRAVHGHRVADATVVARILIVAKILHDAGLAVEPPVAEHP